MGTLLSTLPPVNVETQTMDSKFLALNQSLPVANTEMGNVAGGVQNMRVQTDMTVPKLAELQGAIDALHGKDIAITITISSVAGGSVGGQKKSRGARQQAGEIEEFEGGRAVGGPVTGGNAYLVGERGPELFVPNTNGQIVSNGNIKGAGGGVTLNNYGVLQVKSVDELTTPRTRRQASLGVMR